MKRINGLGLCAVSWALFSMLVVQPAIAADAIRGTSSKPVPAAPVVRDVELAVGGVLKGQVLDTQGAPVADSPVVLASHDRVVAQAKTDVNGKFAFQNLRGDTYIVATIGGGGAYRLWAPQTSPPGAKQAIMLAVSPDPVVRAQHGFYGKGHPGFWAFVSNPWVSATLLTAAIAIPIAAANDSGS
ncbi:MAG: carboxypeptidase regulatory-like domain-containing protein [Planctomycetota bacterium]|nr:MAG: carboxypeptidase regulatory-like domain-containing protein [Planctomycetota bacterium]REJ93657.1 MAG: carboxypeptidase regulatory-like domain-containing protein [Planctomycetota bacterium]